MPLKSIFLFSALLIVHLFCFARSSNDSLAIVPKQKIIIIMMDGFGPEYLEQSDMPNLKRMMAKGLYKNVSGMMPSVTNCNNAAICTGTFPSINGIVGNSYYNEKIGKEEFLEDSSLCLAPTIFSRAAKFKIKSALFSSKLKTIHLLSKGTDLALSPENADAEWIKIIGKIPDRYSTEVNFWTLRAAMHTMKTRPEIGLYYIHTTDFPMHMWKADDQRSKTHLHTIDSLIGEMEHILPDAAIFITADHGMNHKSKVWDLSKALANRGLPIKNSVCASKDLYPKHHLGFGGVVYLTLNKVSDTSKAKKILLTLPGVESVYTRFEAARIFHEYAPRIGDLFVIGDKNTVLGEASKESDTLLETYRSHGSLYELTVPLIIYNIKHPAYSFFNYNKDLASWLY